MSERAGIKKHLRNGKKRMLQVALHDRQTCSFVVVRVLGVGAIFHDGDDDVLYGESPHHSFHTSPLSSNLTLSSVPSKPYLAWRFPRFRIDAIAGRTTPFPFPRERRNTFFSFINFMHNDKHSRTTLALERLLVCSFSHCWEPAGE